MEHTHIPPYHVLYADDDSDDRYLFLEGIKESGVNCKALLFENGFRLLEYLKDISIPKPDIIFLDVNMPLMNGRVCLSQIKQHPVLRDTPVIMLSTSVYEAQSLLEQGASYFFSKSNFFKEPAVFFSNLFTPEWRKKLLEKQQPVNNPH